MDRHYYCIKDNLGSTVAVVDGDGVTRQLTAYYPSGVPYDLTAARATDRLQTKGKPKGRFFWLPLAKYIKHPILLQTKNRPFDFIFCYI